MQSMIASCENKHKIVWFPCSAHWDTAAHHRRLMTDIIYQSGWREVRVWRWPLVLGQILSAALDLRSASRVYCFALQVPGTVCTGRCPILPPATMMGW